MQVLLSKWGNSLGLRLPRALASQLGLAEGQTVEVRAEGDRLVVVAARPLYRVEDLLSGMTPRKMREAWDWGSDKGREDVE